MSEKKTPAERYRDRERGLAMYAVAAERITAGIRDLFTAVELMEGNDPLMLAEVLSKARDLVGIDPTEPRPPKKVKRTRSPGPQVKIEDRAKGIWGILAEHGPLTPQALAEKIADGISASGVKQALGKMVADPELRRLYPIESSDVMMETGDGLKRKRRVYGAVVMMDAPTNVIPYPQRFGD